jgi:aminocarboxymuconate-semialdehyde decarboxylase
LNFEFEERTQTDRQRRESGWLHLIIDAHWHLNCPEAAQKASQLNSVKASDYAGGVKDVTAEINLERAKIWNRKMADPHEQVKDLDDAGIDIAILQPPPIGYYYWTEPPIGAELSRMVNEATASFVQRYAERFLGWATVPLQDTELAIKEARYAIETLKLCGVTITSNVNGVGLDDEKFLPFFATVEELDVPIFIHPGNPPGAERMRDYYLTNFLGFPLDTTLAVALLVFGGVFDRYPNLKICLAHAGGVLPFLLGRFEHGQAERPEARERCKHPFSHYLKNIYVDTVTFRADILQFVISVMPQGHIFFGTDYPFDMADLNGINIVKSAITDKTELVQVFSGTISSLIQRPLSRIEG